jgi:Domain of unknown function (DUF4404)
MDHQKLRNDLRKLHGELRSIKSLDKDEQTMLRLLESDIEELLMREGDNLKPDPDARQRLSEALARVDAAHPRVTLLVRQMVDSLAYLGI